MSGAVWTRHGDDLVRVKVPLPFSLKWVNAYLLPGAKGWTLIDPGLHTEDTVRCWETTLPEIGIRWEDIASIVVTHHHPDHYGLAGYVQQRSGTPVWITTVARRMTERLWGNGETFSEELTTAFVGHGLPQELAGDMLAHMRGFVRRVSPQPGEYGTEYELKIGATFRMADMEWELLGGEGHAPGHALFLDRTGGRLLCGDQVLPDITPNIGWMPGGDPDPLGSFLASLARLSGLSVHMAFPGHRDPFTNFAGRIREIAEHHDRRLNRMLEMVGGSAVTAFELCERLFGERLRENVHNLRFALAETIAHVVYLERQGELVCEGDFSEEDVARERGDRGREGPIRFARR